MEIDMSTYLGPFLDEVDEQLQILEKEVLHLEQDCENTDTIQKIFRAAHTLKGSSAAMGMEQMKELTHTVENVFDSIRHRQLKVDTNIVNIIFDSIDRLKLLKAAILDGTLDSVNVSEVIAQLEACKNTKEEGGEIELMKKETPKPLAIDTEVFPKVILDIYQKSMIEKALELGMNVMAVYVSMNEETMLKSVRAFLIDNNLREIGEIIASFPPAEVIEDEEKFTGHVVYILVTNAQSQEVLSSVNSISDIKSVEVHLITVENLENFGSMEKTDEKTDEKIDEKIDEKTESVDHTYEKENISTSKSKSKVQVQQTVRVDVERLESLLNLVGELVISQTRLTDVRSRLAERYPNDPEMEGFQSVENHIGQIVSELHEGMMKTRMHPIEHLFNRFPRMVRDITQKINKDVNFVMEGNKTELDRNLIEEISDPIIHLLRNALDHGIESPEEREKLGKPSRGTVRLKAAHEENHVMISISDDGKGIDTEKLKQSSIKKGLITEDEANRMTEKEAMFLIFKSGISTANKITDISGRGVGMDIVLSHIEKLNGIIDIDTKLGIGTRFTIKLPLTLAIIRSLLVQIGEKEFAIPLANVQEIIRLSKEEIKTIQNQEVGIVRGHTLPLLRLHQRFNTNANSMDNQKRVLVVVVGLAEKRVGIVIDRTLGNQEIVIKSLGKYIGTQKYIAGATIKGDGKVALILDVGSIVREEGSKDVLPVSQEKGDIQDERLIGMTSFNLGDEEYGIEIEQVQDIIKIPDIKQTMNSPLSILGMSNYRGTLISVMDLRARLGLPEQPLSRKSRIIVVKIKNELLGLLVDQVTQVFKVNENQMEHAPHYDSQVDQAYIRGIYHLGERLLIALDINHIIEIESLLQLH